MRVENRQMSFAAYARWAAKVTRACYEERYFPYGAEPTSVPETSVAAMPRTGSINNFRKEDHGHQGNQFG